MEAATVETTPETSPAEGATPAKMYNYSEYVHVGPGASECEHGTDGACQDPTHFHAWCRLPNQFERKSLQDKAAAMKARKLRALRDPESDSRLILDSELEATKVRGDKEPLIEEIVNQEFLRDQLDALKEVQEEADGDYDTIDEDRERKRALEEMPEDDRPEEEFTYLVKRLAEHTEKVNATRDRIQLPRREAVEAKPIEELCDLVREQRMENIANQEHSQEYAKWQWYICTFQPKAPDKPGFPSERVWGSIDAFSHAAPEAIQAVTEVVGELEKESSETLKGFF